MTENDKLEQALKICRNLLDLDPPETMEKIKAAIEKVNQILPLESQSKTILYEKLLRATGVEQEAPRILDKERIQPWIIDKWADKPDQRKFWRRYRDFLVEDKKFPPQVMTRLDNLTDNILDRLADPEAHDEYDKRGLVVGHVQSGKTSNYIGLMAKAADAGYRLIIVLAGIHNSLRSQTQLRIDEGFLGYDTLSGRSSDQSSNRMGVGKIDRYVAAHSLTSNASNGDFRKTVAETVTFSLKSSDPIVVVIKKNNSVLKNLIQWLDYKEGEETDNSERIINNIPLLLIDDEADNASINISKSSVSAINGSIRALLRLFRKSAYVGYTATPYANVFIPVPDDIEEEPHKGLSIMAGKRNYPVGEDLFPRNFIINISPPSNYIGPEKVFGIVRDEDIDVADEDITLFNLYRPVSDYQPVDYFGKKGLTLVAEKLREGNSNFIPDGHKKDDAKPDELPASLKEAIRYFIIVCATRRARNQINVHNSMLIHVTRFIDWQNHIAYLVEEELSRCRRKIEFSQQDFMLELGEIWENDFTKKTKEIIGYLDKTKNRDPEIVELNWEEVRVHLLPAVTKIQLRVVHGSKESGALDAGNLEPIDYYEYRKKGFSVIAVGGNKLSRGLTLEGLSVSYYLRASKMYDTLMQMGRWFGYRPGYLDLCRLFTSRELVSHYKHIALATEEMRAEFDRMALLRKQPLDFGLRVRAHTGVLTITAANKFRYRKMMSFSYSGELEETHRFDLTQPELFSHNHKLVESFIPELGTPAGPSNKSTHLRNQKFVWRGQNNHPDIVSFLNRYESRQQSFHTGLITQYIDAQARTGKLINWTIALINNSSATAENRGDYYGLKDVGLSYRKNSASAEGGNYYDLTKAHIIGNFHEYIDLTNDELQDALELTKADRQSERKDPEKVIHPSPVRIRTHRPETNGLLLIYPLNPSPDNTSEPYSSVPIIGLALSFPYLKEDEKIVYAINDVFQKELYDYPDELDLEDLDREDDYDTEESKPLIRTLNSENFVDLIESETSLYEHLHETEFRTGLVPRHSTVSDLMERKDNQVVSTSELKKIDPESLPYYSEKEVQRFYLNSLTEKRIFYADSSLIAEADSVIGLKQSRYVIFSFVSEEAAFSDSFWIIQSKRFSTRYLITVLNSTLFGVWVRLKGEQKKDTHIITDKVLKEFPLLKPVEEDIWLFENLFELLVAAGKSEREQGSGTMQSYYSNILDALVFGIYFRDSLSTLYRRIKSELAEKLPRKLPGNDELEKLSKDLFGLLYDKKNPVREAVFHLENHSKVNEIRSEFTR